MSLVHVLADGATILELGRFRQNCRDDRSYTFFYNGSLVYSISGGARNSVSSCGHDVLVVKTVRGCTFRSLCTKHLSDFVEWYIRRLFHLEGKKFIAVCSVSAAHIDTSPHLARGFHLCACYELLISSSTPFCLPFPTVLVQNSETNAVACREDIKKTTVHVA
jgi:hypothetical protein